ncbi:MAG TPA: hypothetical protein VFW87_20795 [Pirellulales bacterium]|nr:hypothetical protein [Pirellulales bacterium]
MAEKLVAEGRNNPHSAYFGKLVGIANGEIVAVVGDWDELARRLREAEADPSKTFGVEINGDEDTIDEIWELH